MSAPDLTSALPSRPLLSHPQQARLAADYDRFRGGLPPDLRAYCLETYGLDLTGEYAGAPIKNPFGKASGQLSLNVRQVRRDAEAGLGFIVLKTGIAEDERGERSMSEWAIHETRMRVERIQASDSGPDDAPGWTVTWKGRGWHDTFSAYCAFFGEAVEIARDAGTRIAASVKYHLPPPGQSEFRVEEYRHTTGSLLRVWRERAPGPLPLEKDFSPTLAGDDRSREREQILRWLREVPELIRSAADESNGEAPFQQSVCLGVKLMNARFDPDFQVEMVRVLLDETPRPPDFLVYANRLFDPAREFEGKVGVAYGGPDLSRRNLGALARIGAARSEGRICRPLPPISGTGDILTGRTAAQYGLLGATSCQMHTVFQLPDTEFGALTRNKSEAVLHHLILHPETGLVAWLLHFATERGEPVHWRDLPRISTENIRSSGTTQHAGEKATTERASTGGSG